MTTFYVDPAGSDGAAGTSPGSAWQNLSKLANSYSVGDEVLFLRGGGWRGTVNITSQGLIVGAYGSGANPIISGGATVAGWSLFGSNTYNATLASLPGVPPIVTFTLGGSTTVLTLGAAAGSLTAFQYFFTGGQLYVNLGGVNPSTGVVEYASACPITTHGSNYTFRSIDVNHAVDGNLQLQDGVGHMLDSCSFRYGTMASGGIAGVVGILRGTPIGSSKVRVTNCTWDWCANDGIYCTNTKNVEIDRCRMTNIGTLAGDQQSDGIQFENYSGTLNGDGLWVHDNYVQLGNATPKGCILINAAPSGGASSTGIVEGNICVGGNFGVGAHASGIKVRNNTMTGQTQANGAGVWIDAAEVYTGIDITYNLVYGSQMGISGGSGANNRTLRIVNNTFVDCSLAFIFIDSPLVGGMIQDNIFWNPGANPTNHIIYLTAVSGGFTSDYNILHRAYANCLRVGVTEYANLAAWTAGTGFDSHSLQGSDPRFTGAADRPYGLSATSPAVNAGVAVAGIDQVVSGAAPDMGAFELMPVANRRVASWRIG